MLDANYQLLRRQTEAILDGQIGLAYVDEKQYRLARSYLREAVASQPDNTQYVYGLATALLTGENRDEDDGFWYLARAVDLTRGTAWGAQLAEYARKEYHSQGGSEADWNTFLSVASNTPFRPSSTATVAGTAAKPSVAPAQPSALSSSATASTAPAQPSSGKTTKVEARSETKDRRAEKRKQAMTEQAAQEALMRDSSAVPQARPEPAAKIRSTTPNPPVSLGVLIQTSLLTRENRQVILSTLKELVNSLRRGDELCILVFSDQLDFEQDLTANDELLEQAIGGLKPKPGRALLDGIAFSAGHLKRIGKNPNRVLVVISDGRSEKLKQESLPLSAQITGVKIDCIGFKVEGASEKDLLQKLAYYSGGKAAFASNPGEFRAAAVLVAQNVGIQF
jgi:Mg-chelatase subunit ChlD